MIIFIIFRYEFIITIYEKSMNTFLEICNDNMKWLIENPILETRMNHTEIQ